MIIWLASYPKSGNTWVRSIISSLVYSKDGIFNFELLKKIQQFPNKDHFLNLTDKFQDIHELKKFWVLAQEKININDKVNFFKTHHINCKIDNYPFTNKDNTLATIYIVRDPRNLINSFSNHYSMDKKEAKKHLLSPKFVTGTILKENKKNNVFTILGSWKDHFNSWTKNNSNVLIIRYEDLLLNTITEINKIIKFINNYIYFDYDDKKIDNILKTTSFDKMKEMENNFGFEEAVQDKRNLGNKKKFFHLGKDNKWETFLERNEADEIENAFRDEMKELKYL